MVIGIRILRRPACIRKVRSVVGGYVVGDGAPRGRPDDPNVAAPAIAPLPPNGGGEESCESSVAKACPYAESEGEK